MLDSLPLPVAERAGREELAGEYWIRAGRSGARRGEPDAREWLERALRLGKRIGNAALLLEAESMLGKLQGADAPKWIEK